MRNTNISLLITAICLILIGCGQPTVEPRSGEAPEKKEALAPESESVDPANLNLADDADAFVVEDAGMDDEEPTKESAEEEEEATEEAITESIESEHQRCIDRVNTLKSNRWRVQRMLDNLSSGDVSSFCDALATKYADQIETLKSYEGKTIIAIGARAITGTSWENNENCGKFYVYVWNTDTNKFDLDVEKDYGTCTGASTYVAGVAGVLMQSQNEEGETYYKYGTAGLLYGPGGAVLRLRTPTRVSTFGVSM